MKFKETGHYVGREKSLLKEFRRNAKLALPLIIDCYDNKFADDLQREARRQFEKIIPEIPYIKGGVMFNFFIIIIALEMSVYKAMKKQGRSPKEAWEICRAGLRLRLAEMPTLFPTFLKASRLCE